MRRLTFGFENTGYPVYLLHEIRLVDSAVAGIIVPTYLLETSFGVHRTSAWREDKLPLTIHIENDQSAGAFFANALSAKGGTQHPCAEGAIANSTDGLKAKHHVTTTSINEGSPVGDSDPNGAVERANQSVEVPTRVKQGLRRTFDRRRETTGLRCRATLGTTRGWVHQTWTAHKLIRGTQFANARALRVPCTNR